MGKKSAPSAAIPVAPPAPAPTAVAATVGADTSNVASTDDSGQDRNVGSRRLTTFLLSNSGKKTLLGQ